MNLPNSNFKLIGYLLLVFLQVYCPGDGFGAANAKTSEAPKGAVEVTDFGSDGIEDIWPPDVNILETEISTHSRTLKQRTDGTQSEDEFECGLSSSERRRYFDESTQQWLVTNEILRELENDIQAIVNCTSENDVIVFRSTRVIRPATTITLPWNLTLRADSSVTFTCPRRGPLVVTRTPTAALENLVVVDCNGSSSVIVLSPTCDGASSESITQLSHLTFQDNEVFEQGHLVEVGERCFELNINGLVFLHNRCIGTHCVVLGARNTLTDIYLVNNQGSNETSLDSSILFASVGSESTVRDVSSLNNKMRSFYISDSRLRIQDSRFDGNRRNLSSGTRDSSIGGGALFSNHSSIFITNTTFENNSAFNGGALFSWTSNITVSDCRFRVNDALGGNGGAIYGHYNSSFDVSSSELSKNRGYRGAGLYSNYTMRVTMANVNVSENYCSRSGAVSITSGVARIRLCSFQRNIAFQGAGALGTRAMNLSLTSSTFSGNVAGFGGACIFEYDSIVHASALLFENNTASETDGGGIFFNLGGYMRIRDSLFRNNYASSDGGAIYTTWDCETVLNRVVFSNNTSEDYAGALQIWRGNFTGSDLTFTRNRATNFGGAISFFEATNVSVSRSYFEGNNAASAGAVQFYFTVSSCLEQCTFIGNSGAETGGAMFATTSNLNISASFFRVNSASGGGAVYLVSFSNTTILDSRFVENTAERNGGAIFALANSRLLFSNATFTRNRGLQGGALSTLSNSNISGSRMEFEDNYAVSGAGLQLFSSATARISESLFSNNTVDADGAAIDSSDNCQLSILDTTLVGNSGGTFGGSIRVWNNSTLALELVRFNRNEAQRGGALSLAYSSIAMVTNCSFTRNAAINSGGGIRIENNSTMTLTNSSFSENIARFGGGFYAESNSTAILSYNNFESSRASGSGGAMYLHTSNVFLFSIWSQFNRATFGGSLAAFSSSMEILNSTIRGGLAGGDGGGIYTSETNATLQRIRLESNVARDDGGGIYAIRASRINATNIDVLRNIAGDVGGGISLGNASSLLCFSCSILNNRAVSGAGLYAFSNNSITIVAQLQNSRFENNSAESYGGGIEFAAPQNISINCTTLNVTCGHIILLNTSFVDNHANRSGAIVLTADPNMMLVDCDYRGRRNQDFINERGINSLEVIDPRRLCSSWKRNRVSSLEYGGVVGTLGQEIVVTIDPEAAVRLVGSTRTGYVLESVSSGRQLPTINVTILDGYGAGPAPTFPHSFEARLSSPDGLFNGLYSTTIAAGVGNFSRVIGLVIPGTYTLEFDFDNEGFETFNVTVLVRECIVGEEPTRDRLTCQECDDFSYNFNTTEVGGCKECPYDATCRGRYIVPNEGSWHNSPCHDQVKECLVKAACQYKNRLQILTNFTQNFTDCNMNETTLESYREDLCNEGYEGPLCGSCKDSFGLSLLFRCLKCPHKILSLFIVVAVTLYLLVTASFTIRGSLPFEITKAHYKSRRIPSNETLGASVRDPEINVEMVQMMVEGHVPREYFENRQRASTSQTAEASIQQENEYELTRWKSNEIFKTIAVAGSVDFNWTDGVNGLFEASEYIGAMATSAISGPIDCLASFVSKVMRAILRMLFSLLVPGIVMCFFAILWCYLALRHNEDISYFTKRTVLSIIAVTYISYLGLTRMAVRAFYCVDVYDSVNPFVNSKTRYWAIDTSVECYERDHSGIIALAVVVLIVVTIAFPLISAVILSKNKEDHMRRDSWMFETAGFLFRAFKQSCLFWESMVMLRKACLSLIVVFSYPLGGLSQGTLAIVVLVTSLFAHLMIRPYRQDFQFLNHLESTSLFVSCLTFTLGLFFENERCSESVRSFLSVVIIMGNALFFMLLCFVLFSSWIAHLRVVLHYENVQLDDKTSWWIVLRTFITSRSRNPRN